MDLSMAGPEFLPMAAIVAIMLASSFLHGVFGIGFAMIATPLLALWMEPREAVLLAAVPLWCIALGFLGRHFAQVRRCGHLVLLPCILVGSVLGVQLQSALSARASWLLLAGLLLLSAVVPALAHRMRERGLQPPPAARLAFGLGAGVTESSLNVGAPLIVLYGGLLRQPRMEQLILLNLCFATGKTVQLGLTLAQGEQWIRPSWLLVAVVTAGLGYMLGLRWMGRLPEHVFRRSLACFLCAMAGLLILRAIWGSWPES